MDPFLGEVRLFAGNFAPKGWALCNGQILPIQQNTALFSLLGTYYGGNGQTTFALPNLNGNVVIGAGQGPGLSGRVIGETGGSPTVTLSSAEMPVHAHTALGYPGNGTTSNPENADWGQYTTTTRPPTQTKLYGPPDDTATMAALALGVAGQNAPHNNMQPYLALNYIIALEGVFPPRG